MRKFVIAALAFALGFALAMPAEAGCGRGLRGLLRGGAAKAKAGLSRTRFFDGDGRPFRKAN